MKRKTQLDRDIEYFERMKSTIYRDLSDWRDISALLGSIARSGDWWVNKLKEVKKEVLWERYIDYDPYMSLEDKIKKTYENQCNNEA